MKKQLNNFTIFERIAENFGMRQTFQINSDFPKFEFEKNRPTSTEGKGYAEVIENAKLKYLSQFLMTELRKP